MLFFLYFIDVFFSQPVELESWDAWGQENEQPMSNGADPVASSIATFYASRKHVQEESAPVPETDYFSEMKPSLRKAPKASYTLCQFLNLFSAETVTFSFTI